jgi:hypothetical protein
LQSEAQNKKELIETAQLLEKKVITPLKGLIQNLLFHLNLLQETYLMQSDLIYGQLHDANKRGGAKVEEHEEEILDQILTQFKASGSNKDELLVKVGINGIIHFLKKENQSLNDRMQSMQQRNEDIKAAIDRYLNVIMNTRRKLSKGEILYKEQLEDWIKLIPKLTKDIENIKQTINKQKLLQQQLKMAQSGTQTPHQSASLAGSMSGKPAASSSTSFLGGNTNTNKAFPTGFNANRPSFFQANKIASFNPLGSPITKTSASSSAQQSQMAPSSAHDPFKSTSSTLGGMNSPSLSFNTTLGSGNKLKTTSSSFLPNHSGIRDSPMTMKSGFEETPVKGIPMREGDEDPSVSMISSELKKTMTLNELSSAEKKSQHKQQQSTFTQPLAIDLSEQDQELCMDLLKSEEDMIQQSKKKLLNLEKKLHFLQKSSL